MLFRNLSNVIYPTAIPNFVETVPITDFKQQ